jgi:hypothetical protein
MVHWLRGLGFWLIPIGLFVVGTINGIVKMIIDRRERRALIAQGIDPDTVRKQAPTLR